MQRPETSDNSGFIQIKESLTNKLVINTLQSFTMGQIVSYFVEAIAADKQPAKDHKSLRESSFQLFRGGHVVKCGFQTLIVKCSCLPEMRKDRIYNILVRIKETSAEIQFAKCDCIAGKGPSATCKHIAALCYALEDFNRNFLASEDSLSCTDRLMKWNQPRKRKLDPKRISELDFSVEHHGTTRQKSFTKLSGRDPIKIVGEATKADVNAVEEFVSRLHSFSAQHPKQKSAFLSVICANNKINTKAMTSGVSSPSNANDCESLATSAPPVTVTNALPEPSVIEKRISFKESLKLNEQQRNDLFEQTKNQSDCELWFKERAPRITGSICGRIINRIKHIYPSSILKSLQTTSSISTASTLLGKQQEPFILARYIEHQRANGYPYSSAERAGFLVDKEKGWLGASADGVVHSKNGTGCVEIKAAAADWESDILSIVAQRKNNFCLHKDGNSAQMTLKPTHVYYNQCQLQLYVGRDKFSWSDFVLATRNDLFVQRIKLDMDWVEKNIPELENFYDSFFIKKLVA